MGRPSKNLISPERAVWAALEIIDEQGLNAFSVELVARRLGVRAPSLYYYFSNKADLLSNVALYILQEISAPPRDAGDWEETIVELCTRTRRTILQHPNAAPLLLEFFPRHIFAEAYDFWAGQCPHEQEVRLAILEGTEKLTFGSALFAAAARAHSIPAMPDIDDDGLPNLAKAVRANPYNDEDMFRENIRAFLAGFRPSVRGEAHA